jgi:hypothetical protein
MAKKTFQFKASCRLQHDLIPCGSETFFFERVHIDDRVKLLLKDAVFLSINHKAVGLLSIRLTIISCF